jgi:hypothetical protein
MLVLRLGPVDAVEADHPDDPPGGVDHGRLQAVVVGDLLARRADEGQHVGRLALARHPRHPWPQVVAVGVDEREQLVGVGLFEKAQRVAARKLVAEHA